jgi:hypothetical protein
MPKAIITEIAHHLEKLPLELYEPILENLTFRDVIALVKYSGEEGRLTQAVASSPRWKSVWPIYKAHESDFQALVALMVPVGGGRLFDPTRGALDLTPGQLHRRMAREQTIHGPNFNSFDYIARQASDNIQNLLRNKADYALFNEICKKTPLETIPVICPWLKNHVAAAEQRHASEKRRAVQAVREMYRDALEGECRCFGAQDSTIFKSNPLFRACSAKHPGRETAHWTVPQMKSFVDVYSAIQKEINETKAAQLRELARLCRRYPTLLKEPGAPQGPRKNHEHIPKQFEIVSGFVERIIDLDPRAQRRSRQGISKFRYMHPCLVPYDWCLHLWSRLRDEDADFSKPPSGNFGYYLRHRLSARWYSRPKVTLELLDKFQTAEKGLRLLYNDSVRVPARIPRLRYGRK